MNEPTQQAPKPKLRRSRRHQPKSKRAKNRRELIEGLLREPVKGKLNGKPKSVSALEAMMWQLSKESANGNKKAIRVQAQFRRWARKQQATKRIEIVFVESDYTHALSSKNKEKKNG